MKKIILILITILLYAGIFWLSSKDAKTSSAQSDDLIINLKLMTREEMVNEPEKANNYSFIVRKLAHFSIYGILGIFVYLSIKEFLEAKIMASPAGLLLTGVGAAVDEFHQSFVPGRGMEFSDVLIDMLGAGFGILLVISISFLVNTKKRHNPIHYYNGCN